MGDRVAKICVQNGEKHAEGICGYSVNWDVIVLYTGIYT
jgi:hypothetical protein